MVKLKLNKINPLTLMYSLVEEWDYSSMLEIEYIDYLPQFDMTGCSANVGDITRVLTIKEDVIISSSLSQTSKLILSKDREIKKIMASVDQSLGIYAEMYLQKNNMNNVEIVTEIKGKTRNEALNQGLVDGAMFIDPFTLKFANEYKTVFSGEESGYNFTCVAFKRSEIEYIDEINAAVNKAIIRFNGLCGEEKLKLCKKYLTIVEGIEEYYKNLEFDVLRQYQKKDLDYVYNWMTKKGYLTKEINLEELIYEWR